MMQEFQEFVTGLAIVVAYFGLSALAVIALRRIIRMPDEVSRKSLHFIVVFSMFIWTYAFQTWWIAALAALSFVIVVFPVLAVAERFRGYASMLAERKRGEVKRSLVVALVMIAAVISICWGWLDDKLLVLASVFAWGFGDGAAALIGKRFGRRFLQGKWIEGRKSVEGTAAMFAASFAAVIVVLLIRGGLPWYSYVPITAVTAAVAATVELFTRDGFDTITCPLAAAAVIIPLVQLGDFIAL